VPITRLLPDTAFDPEAIDRISVAFESSLELLGLTDLADPAVAMVAIRVFDFAGEGERDPVRLCELTVRSFQPGL